MSITNIDIIGAGLVGSLLAIRLSQLQYRVQVFESRPDMRKQTISAGRSINLALANRGLKALTTAGLKAQIDTLTITMRGRVIHSESGATQFQSYGQRNDEVIYSISRAELNSLLMNEAEKNGAKISFNAVCNNINLQQKKFDILSDSLTSTHHYQLLLGADGANSPLRAAIADTTDGHNRYEALDHSYKELSIPATSSGGWQIEKEALHIWPRESFMLIALPNLDGSFTVTLFMPNDGEVSFASINTTEKLQAFFKRFFPDALALIPKLNEDYFANPTGKLGTVRCTPWHFEDSALILGDAAHAIVPFHGQGMNCGFEDVACFIEQINAHSHDFGQAITSTEVLRKPNGDAIADLALENYIEMRSLVRDKKFLLKKAIAFALEKRYPTHFIPRYSLVMFHHLPYAEAQEIGQEQTILLDALAKDIDHIEELDWAQAESLIARHFPDAIL